MSVWVTEARRHLAAVDRCEEVQRVLVVDAVAADLHAAVAVVAGDGLLDLAGLLKCLHHRRGENLAAQRLVALGLGGDDDVLPEVLGEIGQLVVGRVIGRASGRVAMTSSARTPQCLHSATATE